MKTQIEIYQSIRKPLPPRTKVERPVKGRGFKRHQKHKKNFYGEE